jgi:haloalkane dehalogenase
VTDEEGRMRRITVDGTSVPVLDEGQGPPVLLLHGNPDSSAEWTDVMALLGPRHRCVAPDLPGFGGSSPPAAGYDFGIDAQVAFLDGLVTQLDLRDPVTVVVHDIGAVMGLAWAASHPSRVRAIVVTNTVVGEGYAWHAMARAWATPVVGELFMLAMTRGAFRRALASESAALAHAHADRIYDRITPTTRRSILRLYRRMTRPGYFAPWRSRLEALVRAVPTRVLWGVRDPFIPESFAEHIAPDVVRLPDCGHWVPLEAPEVVAAHVEMAAYAGARRGLWPLRATG